MIVREGKSVFKGVAIGSIFVYKRAKKAFRIRLLNLRALKQQKRKPWVS